MEKIKLLLVSDIYQIHTRRWAEWFAREGFEVLIASESSAGYEVPGCMVADLSGQNLIEQFFSIKKLIAQFKPDILHAHTVSKKSWLSAACNFHPFVLTAWGSDVFVDAHKNIFYELMARYTLRKADVITSDSEALKSETIRMGGTASGNHVIHWGIDLDTFKPGLDTKDLRKKMRLEGKKVIFSGRHFFPKYNIMSIIRSFPDVLKKIPETVLVLKTAWKDPDYEKELRAAVSFLGIDANVRYVGELEHSDMPLFYNMSDLFISVPFSDSISISILEAMACGCVPVVGDLESTRECFKDGVNGRMVPVTDVAALSRAITDLLGNEKTMTEIKANNLNYAKESFDQNMWMSKMKGLYLGAVNERK